MSRDRRQPLRILASRCAVATHKRRVQMSSFPVRCLQRGLWCAIVDPPEEVVNTTMTALSYVRKDYDGQKNRMNFKNIRCCQVQHDPRGAAPPQLLFLAGHKQRLAAALADRGMRLKVKKLQGLGNVTSPTASRFDFSRLEDASWRWGQERIIRHLADKEMGQLKLCTGFGKTRLLSYICDAFPDAKIAITSAAVDVLENIYNELAARIPNVGLFSSRRKSDGHRVVCVSGKSLHRLPWAVDLFLCDEVHDYGTANYMRGMSSTYLNGARRFGFSASVGDRQDDADFELEGMFGPTIVNIPYSLGVKHGCVVPIQVRWTKIEGNDPVKPDAPRWLREKLGLWNNAYRNAVIAAQTKQFGEDEQQLITVTSIEHAVRLKHILPHFTLVHAENNLDEERRRKYIEKGYLQPNEPVITAERRENLRAAFEQGSLKRVIATGVWNQGVNFKRLAVLHRADAASSKVKDTQIPARTSRLCDETGKSTGVVFDYFDAFNPKLKEKSRSRLRHYEAFGWEQRFVSIYSGEGSE